MNYSDGVEIRLGDTVHLGHETKGQVVGLIELGTYLDDLRSSDWDYLARGILVNTDFGIIRLEAADEDLELLNRYEQTRPLRVAN